LLWWAYPQRRIAPVTRWHLTYNRKGSGVIPISPLGQDILVEKVYPRLLEVPFEIDIVDIFRKPEAVLEIVKEAIEKRAKVEWMQEGVINNEAAELARKAGIRVVMDRCIKKDHQKLFG